MSTSDFGFDSSFGDPQEIIPVPVVDEESEGTPAKGNATGANPESGGIGVVLPLVTNPDGSRSFTGDRNIDAVLIGSKWGTLNLTYSFPTSGSNYNGTGLDLYGGNASHVDL